MPVRQIVNTGCQIAGCLNWLLDILKALVSQKIRTMMEFALFEQGTQIPQEENCFPSITLGTFALISQLCF